MRIESGNGSTASTGLDVTVDELADEVDPYDCEDCLTAGDVCKFHAGFAQGWDACAAFVGRAVEEQRAAEVTLDDIEGLV